MKNLRRALWMTLKYKWSLIGSFLCCLCVAVLWGANLGAVYPFVEIVMQKKTLAQWVDQRSEESDVRIAESKIAIEDLQLKIEATKEADAIAALETKVTLANAELDGEVSRQWWTQLFAPWIKSFAPTTPFATLGWLMGLMFMGTVMRGLFLMGNMVLVARVGQRTVLDMQNDVFRNVLDMEVSELGVRGTGDLVSRIRGETGAIGQAISILFGKTIREPMKMAVCLGGAAWFNWRLLLFSMLICPLAGYLMMERTQRTEAIQGRRQRRLQEEHADRVLQFAFTDQQRTARRRHDHAQRFGRRLSGHQRNMFPGTASLKRNRDGLRNAADVLRVPDRCRGSTAKDGGCLQHNPGRRRRGRSRVPANRSDSRRFFASKPNSNRGW